MGKLVHRRVLPGSALPEPGGPGSTIGPLVSRLLAPFTWIGRLSLLAAVAVLVVDVNRIVTDSSAISSLGSLAQLIAADVSSIALVLLPAALEFGAPGVARRNRTLLIGFALLAAAEAARPLLQAVNPWLVLTLGQSEDAFDPASSTWQAAVIAPAWLSIARIVLVAGGWLRVYTGLAAGARPRRAVLVVAVAVLGALDVAADGALGIWVLPVDAAGPALVATNVGALGADLLMQLMLAAAVVALATGGARALSPVRAWRLGALAGIALAVGAIGLSAIVLVQVGADVQLSATFVTVTLQIGGVVASLLLLASCALGLGRGADSRTFAGTRRSAFHVRGTRRFALAAPG